MAAVKNLETKHLDAAEAVLSDITDKSKVEPDPKDHLHIPATHDKAHSWFRSVFPYDSLEAFEAEWHLGNYVMDRQTGEKSFEAMSIYVRLGMHLLYYGSEQQNILQSERAQKMLKDQSLKMGKQYDDPESVDHIQPFIESFELQDTLHELASLMSYHSGSQIVCAKTTHHHRPSPIPLNTALSTSSSPAN